MAKTVELSKFYTRQNEVDGVWYEPKIGLDGIGLECKIKGPSSDEAVLAGDEYRKAQDEGSTIEDEKEKREFEERAVAKLVASLICDVRGKDGNEITLHGKPFEINDMKELIYESPMIAADIMRFQSKKENFLEMKKNA